MACVVEYVWIGGNGEVRSKARVMDVIVTDPSQCPDWNFDGSSTDQASGKDSEVIMKARKMFNDPFRGENGYAYSCKSTAYHVDGLFICCSLLIIHSIDDCIFFRVYM